MQRLRISENGRHFVRQDGRPFLWIGDTAWCLVEALNREETLLYLDNRRAKGFSVIQAAAFMGYGQEGGRKLNPANAYGHRPFNGGDEPDPASPRIRAGGSPDAPTDYWDHLDFVVRETRARGLYLALLPCWGARHVSGLHEQSDAILDAHTARAYGAFLGARYGPEPHVLWVHGGDVGADEPGDKRHVYRRLFEGLGGGATGQPSSWDEAPMWPEHQWPGYL